MIILLPKSPNLSRFKCLFTNKPVISRHKCTLATSVHSPQAFRIRPQDSLKRSVWHSSLLISNMYQTYVSFKTEGFVHVAFAPDKQLFVSLYCSQFVYTADSCVHGVELIVHGLMKSMN